MVFMINLYSWNALGTGSSRGFGAAVVQLELVTLQVSVMKQKNEGRGGHRICFTITDLF